jgi:hypothetical protein
MSDVRNHPARTLQRVAFETSRLAEFCGEKELTAQTGPHRRIGRSLSPRSSRVLVTALDKPRARRRGRGRPPGRRDGDQSGEIARHTLSRTGRAPAPTRDQPSGTPIPLREQCEIPAH